MPIPDTIILAFLYVPGFLVFKFIENQLKSSKKYDTFNTAAFSLSATALIFILYTFVKNFQNLDTITLQNSIPVDFTLIDLAIITTVSIILALTSYVILRIILDTTRYNRSDPWTNFFTQRYNLEGTNLLVYTSDGQVYQGTLHNAPTPETQKKSH